MVENNGTEVNEKSEKNNTQQQLLIATEPNNNCAPIGEDIVLPLNCLPLTHQVAGHFYGKGRTRLGLLQTNDGLVLKPVQSPPRGEREHNFFKHIFLSDHSELNEHEIVLKNLLPTYRGSYIHNDIIYIKMDDIAYGVKYPAVIDFKMGRITYDPEATAEKISRQRLKYPPVENIGFQLLGMRVFNKKENNFSHYDKKFGRALSEENLIHGLALYYQFHQTPQLTAVRETLKKFEEIKLWFLKQTSYHFYSSSLIVIYDAYLEDMLKKKNDDINETNSDNLLNDLNDESNNNNNNINVNNNNNNNNIDNNNKSNTINPYSLVRVIMADFAHVFPANNTLDVNYIYGLERLIKHLQLLLEPSYKFKEIRATK